jgi:phosphoglycolate phosphatase
MSGDISGVPDHSTGQPTPAPDALHASKTAAFRGAHLKAAIIDLDGTMVDTADDFAAALNSVLRGLDLALISRDEVMLYIGKGTERLIKDVLASRLTPEQAEAHYARAYADYFHHYATINGQHSHLYPDVAAGLQAMRALGIRLACVTNKPERFARDLLTHYALTPYFDAIVGGDTVERKKPDPMPMLHACTLLNVTPEQTVAIGDSGNDVAAARAAKMASLTVPYGYNHGEPVQNLPTDAIVSTLLEAAKLIGQHL